MDESYESNSEVFKANLIETIPVAKLMLKKIKDLDYIMTNPLKKYTSN